MMVLLDFGVAEFDVKSNPFPSTENIGLLLESARLQRLANRGHLAAQIGKGHFDLELGYPTVPLNGYEVCVQSDFGDMQ
jgi:hypothetical protein